MIDFAEENPNLYRLIEIIEDYWLKVIKKWIETGVDTIGFGDDLGLQNSLPISPSAWRKYIKPSFKSFLLSARRIRFMQVFIQMAGLLLLWRI